jgi:hypothetical protein
MYPWRIENPGTGRLACHGPERKQVNPSVNGVVLVVIIKGLSIIQDEVAL